MGMRSPQQLEQVQVGVPNLPSVEAGKTSTIDLATPVKNFMEQKAIGDQIASVNDLVITRKDALSKIKSKYAVESVTSEYKSRMAALVGSNAITESQGIFDQASRGLDDLEQKAPADLADQVKRDSQIKRQELQTLMQDKINVEGRKDAINTGNANVKVLSMDAASSFLDFDTFKGKHAKTFEYSTYTEQMKGGSKDAQVFNAAAVASNTVFEGVQFSLSQAATPDRVDVIQKYYNESILKEDSGIHVNTEDQTKINNAFAAAKDKTEGDLGYALAAQAKQMGLDIRAAEEFIFQNARGSTKAATQGYNLFMQQHRADKEEIDKTDREVFGQVVKAMRKGNPTQAEQLTRKMGSPDGELKARNYLNTMEGGSARAFTNNKDREFLSRLQQTDREAFAKVDLDQFQLSREDRRAAEAAKRVIGRDTQEKNFQIDSGSLESKADGMANNLAKTKLGLRVQTDVKLAAQVSQNARDILYEVRDKYPNEKNEAIIMGHVRDHMNDPENGVLKGITKPNILGHWLNKINIDTSGNPWFNTDKIEARPSDEFTSQPQTGGKGQIRVPEPTAGEILNWQAMATEAGKPVDKATAARQITDFRRRKAQQSKVATPE
jgi:hypothetical protein